MPKITIQKIKVAIEFGTVKKLNFFRLIKMTIQQITGMINAIANW